MHWNVHFQRLSTHFPAENAYERLFPFKEAENSENMLTTRQNYTF